MALRIHLKRRGGPLEVDPVAVKRYAREVLRAEGVADGALTLVLTDDAEVRGLNAEFRGRDRETDVLAFPLGEDPDDPGYLGDVIVSTERARDQAPRFHNDVESELARLITHGILHLLGHDHHTPAEGKRMKASERRALRAFVPGTLLRSGGGGYA